MAAAEGWQALWTAFRVMDWPELAEAQEQMLPTALRTPLRSVQAVARSPAIPPWMAAEWEHWHWKSTRPHE